MTAMIAKEKIDFLLREIKEQVGKGQFLNASALTTELQTALLAELSNALKNWTP